jgi:hypothetical protein
MKPIQKMTQDELKSYMLRLKVSLGSGAIDMDEFEKLRAPIKTEIERRMFAA